MPKTWPKTRVEAYPVGAESDKVSPMPAKPNMQPGPAKQANLDKGEKGL